VTNVRNDTRNLEVMVLNVEVLSPARAGRAVREQAVYPLGGMHVDENRTGPAKRHISRRAFFSAHSQWE